MISIFFHSLCREIDRVDVAAHGRHLVPDPPLAPEVPAPLVHGAGAVEALAGGGAVAGQDLIRIS